MHSRLARASSPPSPPHTHSSTYTKLCYSRSQRILHKSRSHRQILGARSKFHTEDSQFRNDVWTSLFSGTLCSVHVNWHTPIYVGRQTAIIRPKILGAVIRNLIAWATRRPAFLQPCPTGNKLERTNHSRASHKHIILWLRFGYIKLACIINIRKGK